MKVRQGGWLAWMRWCGVDGTVYMSVLKSEVVFCASEVRVRSDVVDVCGVRRASAECECRVQSAKIHFY